eukprot:jgi/Mesvir1/22874/Mv20115-RA.1
MERRAIVLDNGTGFTKMGYAGNFEPNFVIPTVVGVNDTITGAAAKTRKGIEDLDFLTGYEALANAKSYTLGYPMKHGQIENWDYMERLYQHCMFKYLRCDPEEHFFLLTEPPLNPPENREYLAEIMFETFNVPGMYIGVQAVLALASTISGKKQRTPSMTGTVIDSGDGVTHVIPVADGYVIGSSIKSVPLAGRDLTAFVQQLMRERGEPVLPEDSIDVARRVKEAYGYTCSDMVKEFRKLESDPSKVVAQYTHESKLTNSSVTVDVAYERFLAPEVFFHPEIFSSDFLTPLPVLVDRAIQSSPIDTRRKLYSNIVLSGGSTMFKDFGRRLQRDIKKMVDSRVEASQQLSADGLKATGVEVNVQSHAMQRYAVWFGGSILASTEEFFKSCHTKAEYEEHGPSICRNNPIFAGL